MSDGPRGYWRSIPDEQLIDARDEYRRRLAQGGLTDVVAAELAETAAEIDDDLARRAVEREALNKAGAA